MKKLKNKIAFVLLFILVSAMSQAKGLDPRFQILPLPQNIEILKGQGIAGSELAYIVSKGESKIPVLGTLLDALPRIENKEQVLHFPCRNRTHPNLRKDIRWRSPPGE